MTTPTVDPQRHVRALPGDVAPYVLIPGDPGRAERIAAAFAEARLIARHREYVLFTGTTAAGTPISVCSTGIGGPSASIAVEELTRVGATHFIRVGSSGGRQPHVPIGSVVVVTGAYRGEGTSQDYIPLPYPAVADLDVTLALRRAAEATSWDAAPTRASSTPATPSTGATRA
jgi:uridine phosphorylase